MRFIILGASGFIGHHLREYLAAQNHETLGTQFGGRSPELLRFDLAQDRILNCVPEPFLLECERCFVLHCTGYGGPDDCAVQVAASRRVNVDGARQLVDDLSRFPARHVYFSTSYVFDGVSGGYRESDPCQPICEYGRQKLAVEQFLTEAAPQSLVLRLDKVIGDELQGRHLFADWRASLRAGRPVRCWRGQTMAPISVGDVARAVEQSCQRSLAGRWHLSGVEMMERATLARRFQQVAALAGTIETLDANEFAFADERPQRCHLDGRAFRQVTGFEPQRMDAVLKRFADRLAATEGPGT